MDFKRGDIVWARALYPHSWWPALVLRIDPFGVLVSFFHSHPPQRYFLESEVRSFGHSFPSLIGTVNRDTPCDETLNQALVLLGRRAGMSLTCPCFEPSERNSKPENLVDVGWNCVGQVLEEANGFLPANALGFVLDAAVSPWIEDADLVIAVTASAVIKRFRVYASMKQKLMYREEDAVPISEEEDTLRDQPRVFCEQVSTDCITNRTIIREPLTPLHEVEASCLQLKRQAEQPDPVHHCFKLRKTKPFFSFSRAYAYLQNNGDSVKIYLLDALSSGSLGLLDVPLLKYTPLCRSTVEIGNFRKHRNSVDIVNGATFKDSVNMVNVQDVSLQERGVCKSDVDVPRSTKGVWSVDGKVDCISSLVQPFASELLLKNVIGNYADEVGNADVATTKHLLSTHLNIDQYKVQSRNGDCPTSLTDNKELSMKSHQPVTADLSSNSQLDQQPEAPKHEDNTILRMKFPKGHHLPSKEEMIKKFSLFGLVDPSNTKVSPYTGAAEVVFLHHVDAVTAYQYAKRKKIFLAQGNVRFSLDPFNCKKEVNFLCPLSSSPLKSCLKKSSSPVENEKITHRVKFRMKS